MAHSQQRRLQRLVEEAEYPGEPLDLIGFMRGVLPFMPEPVAEAMDRFYLQNGTQQMDAEGRPKANDRAFYQHLYTGRRVLVTLLLVAKNRVDVVQKILSAYGENGKDGENEDGG